MMTSILNSNSCELQNKLIMGFGLVAITSCLGYLAYMKTQYEAMGYYVAVQEDGTQQWNTKKSRWD